MLGKRLTDVAFNGGGAVVADEGCGTATSGQEISTLSPVSPPAGDLQPELPAELLHAPAVPFPSETVWPTANGGLGFGRSFFQSARAFKCLYDIQRRLRWNSFQQTIEYMRDSKRRCLERPPSAEAQELLDAFHAARPWFWVAPICRLDAFALALLFWRSGRDANLVFGVRLEPFAAHCWAQAGHSALNEPHPRLFQYTQIMIV